VTGIFDYSIPGPFFATKMCQKRHFMEAKSGFLGESFEENLFFEKI